MITRLATLQLDRPGWVAEMSSDVVDGRAQWTVKGSCIRCGGPAAYLALRTWEDAQSLAADICFGCAAEDARYENE